MSPQATTPTADSKANGDAPSKAQTHELADRLLEEISSVPEDERTSPEKQFLRANSLERERDQLNKRIAANRDYLRLMAANEELPEDILKWLEDFHAEKEKGERRSEDQVEQTRLAKESARRWKG